MKTFCCPDCGSMDVFICNGKGKTSGGYHWKWYEEDSNNE